MEMKKKKDISNYDSNFILNHYLYSSRAIKIGKRRK